MWSYETYKNWLGSKILKIAKDLDFESYSFEIFNEVDYAKEKSIKPKTISIVIKLLPSTIIFSMKSQPIQMLVIAEENSLAVANSIFTTFAETYNFNVIPDGSTYVKHQYSTPVVLSNFNLVGIGFRSVLYINTTLFILDSVMDLNNLVIDSNPIEAISATVGYTMSGDTQPYSSGHARTVKNFSTFVISLNVACVSNAFVDKVMNIMAQSTGYTGDETFAVSFDVGTGSEKISFSETMKLTGATLTTAVNNTPSLQIGLSV